MVKCSLIIVLLTVLCGTATAQDVEGDALRAVANSNLDFTNLLYKKLSHEQGNVFVSPLSIQTILALTAQGARGTTAQEMVRGLLLPQDQHKTKNGFRQLISSLRAAADGVTLKIANKVFTDKRFPMKGEFSTIAHHDFFSDKQEVDFNHKPDEARVNINNWVEESTDHKIKDLLPVGSITTNTAMVLANAVYFKANWETKFDPKNTKPKPFSVSPGVNRDVPMMHMTVTGKLRYKDSSELDAQVLEIPYVNKKVSLVVLLPKTKNDIANLELKLANVRFSNITGRGMTSPRVHVALPKFKVEKSFELKEVLEKLGMTTMFTDSADLSGLAPGPLKISKVVHKAFMEVTEEGTVAAAATGVVSVLRTERVYPEVTFNADHPFIFLLTSALPNDANKKTVIFMGRFSHP